jgi:alkanesulfonate monooxygenase SsuD/methylene tetrahydromethanopterin reductase-like flavin-dependent oxidoreductase (luciferase family)
VKVGVLLPTFRRNADDALAAASDAAAAGLDGVFAYDHLYPMGHPERPALSSFPVLAAVARRQPSLCVGPLVARVGLVPSVTLTTQLRALAALAPGRVIAALGTGDQLSAQENLTYGIAYASADERREELRTTLLALAGEMPLWVGGGSARTAQVARECGAAINLWNRDAATVTEVAASGEVTWAGDLRSDVANQLDELASAGATWVVAAPGSDVAALGRWREAHRGGL